MQPRQGLNAKQVLSERIESIGAQLKAAGYSFPESGPDADAIRLDIKQRLACLLGITERELA